MCDCVTGNSIWGGLVLPSQGPRIGKVRQGDPSGEEETSGEGEGGGHEQFHSLELSRHLSMPAATGHSGGRVIRSGDTHKMYVVLRGNMPHYRSNLFKFNSPPFLLCVNIKKNSYCCNAEAQKNPSLRQKISRLRLLASLILHVADLSAYDVHVEVGETGDHGQRHLDHLAARYQTPAPAGLYYTLSHFFRGLYWKIFTSSLEKKIRSGRDMGRCKRKRRSEERSRVK